MGLRRPKRLLVCSVMEKLMKTSWDRLYLSDCIRLMVSIFSPRGISLEKSFLKNYSFFPQISVFHTVPANKICCFATYLYGFSCLSSLSTFHLHLTLWGSLEHRCLEQSPWQPGLILIRSWVCFPSILAPASFTNRSCLPAAKTVPYPWPAVSQRHPARYTGFKVYI